MTLTHIAQVCAAECERQKVGVMELANLLSAYEYARTHYYYASGRKPEISDILMLGKMIEPEKGRIRTVPVTFANGGSAAPADTVADALVRLCDAVDEEMTAYWFCEAFLKIHPFLDGNGRTAFLLYNLVEWNFG